MTNAAQGETNWGSLWIFDLGNARSEGGQGGQKEGIIPPLSQWGCQDLRAQYRIFMILQNRWWCLKVDILDRLISYGMTFFAQGAIRWSSSTESRRGEEAPWGRAESSLLQSCGGFEGVWPCSKERKTTQVMLSLALSNDTLTILQSEMGDRKVFRYFNISQIISKRQTSPYFD